MRQDRAVPLESRPEWEADAAAAFNEFPPGCRVEYVGPDDRDLTDARPGDVGTVYAVQHIGDLVVRWDEWGGEVWDRDSWKHLRRVDADG